MMFRTPIASTELRLDQSCIFVSEERHPLSVAGKFNISLTQDTTIKSIKVRMRGTLAIPIEGFMGPENREVITFERDQALASSRTLNAFRMPAGDHTFLFDIPIPGKIFETVTGPGHQYHTYRVEAVIERRLKSDLVVSQPVRIYQVSDEETSYLRPHSPLTLEGHSDQNIQYGISIADRNVPFGCTFPVECWFAPLMKDTRLNTVTIKVVEKQTTRLEATASESVLNNIRFITAAHSEAVFCNTIDFPQGNQSGDERSELEWRFSTAVRLPQSLDACSQSISTKHIKITHELTVTAEFGNEAGHVTAKIAETLPFKIQMMPNVVGEDASIRGQNLQRMQGNQNPPPSYNEHFSDLIVAAATQQALCEHPMVAEIASARSSSEQSTSFPVDPAPRYEETISCS